MSDEERSFCDQFSDVISEYNDATGKFEYNENLENTIIYNDIYMPSSMSTYSTCEIHTSKDACVVNI